MAAKGCFRCLRICLLITSVLSMLVGDVIVGVGIYCALFDSQPAVQEVNRVLPTEFFVLKVALISVGSGIVLVSFCACVGVVLKSKCALVLHSVLTCLIALGCSAMAVLSVALPVVNLTIQTQLESSLKRSYGNASLITYAVDFVQSKSHCCGWYTGSLTAKCDWFRPAYQPGSCPPSCCKIGGCDGDKNAYTTSCLEGLKSYLIVLPLTLMACVILSFCHLICSLVLICSRSGDQISAI